MSTGAMVLAEIKAETLKAAYEDLRERLPGAEASDDAATMISLCDDWNALKARVGGELRRRSFALTRNMSCAEAEAAEREMRREMAPIAEAGDSAITRAVLNSQHRAALARRFGARLLTVLDFRAECVAPINAELRVEAGDLSRSYDKLVAQGEVEIGGEMMTLAKAKGLISSEDPALREQAFLAYRRWFIAHRDALSEIFSGLVACRTRMGRQLGYDSYTPLGYRGMLRTDYGPNEVKAFRDMVREHVVPVYAELLKAQAQKQGQDSLKPWDLHFDPELTLPAGVALPIETQLDRAAKLFEKISPALSGHFQRMREEGLIDLENRKNKASGAYCTSFPDEKKVAIFCNSVGDQDDVSTLIHEMGHAFQGWESQGIDAVELRSPSYDACEVHSMGLEYLSQPYLGEFFSEDDRQRFCRFRWRESIDLICYACVVDAFQHEVYENPDLSPDERDQVWNKLYDQFLPGLDWTGIRELSPARWYAQMHIFDAPFYYLDYALAELCAMQLSLAAERDLEGTMAAYTRLCRMGGRFGVLEMLEQVGLRSPFDPALLEDLMAHARSVLGLER